MSKILFAEWSVDFAMDDMMNVKNQEWKKKQMNQQVSFPLWVLEVKKCLLKNMCNWQERKLLLQSRTWAELVDVAWSREIHMDLNLNKEPMKGNDMNDQPTPIVKLPQAHKYAQLWSNLNIFWSFQL